MTYNDLRKGRVSQSGTAYHVTTVTRNRTPHFAALDNGRKVVRELMALQAEGRAETLCYAVMPDHLHWLLVLHEGTLSEVVKLLKGRSAHAIGQAVWQANYFDHAVRQDEDLRKMARYIVANPLRAKLVERIGDYSLWDAVWLDEALSDD
jgi:REP element-mobilizing transposase RayT